MLGFLLTSLVTAFSLLVVDFFVPGVGIATLPVALGAALSIGLVNSSIKPVIKLLSLPISILTLGGFSLVVNGFCFWLASLVVPGFTIHGFFAFIFGPMALSFVSTALTNYLVSKGIDKKLASFGRQQTIVQTEPYEVRPSDQVITVEAVTIS
ncbi:MAG: phage holin family protein [Cyanobacteria bacterium J06623_5]